MDLFIFQNIKKKLDKKSEEETVNSFESSDLEGQEDRRGRIGTTMDLLLNLQNEEKLMMLEMLWRMAIAKKEQLKKISNKWMLRDGRR